MELPRGFRRTIAIGLGSKVVRQIVSERSSPSLSTSSQCHWARGSAVEVESFDASNEWMGDLNGLADEFGGELNSPARWK